jgi:drug/metabolite transporter (DMT)-like permease
MQIKKIYPPMQAILAAILFGASTPLSKLLLGEMDSIVLASLLYLGSGLGIGILVAARKYFAHSESTEAGIRRTDLPWLIGAVLVGGVAAPIILLFGLKYSSAASASLLLNFEGVATTIIAALVFKEAVGKRTVYAITLITLASVLLSWNAAANWEFSLGALGILGACTLWGLDNNFTRNISSKNPLVIVTIKGLGAGIFSLILALFLGKSIPGIAQILLTLLLGFICYGLSIALFILALRNLGVARTSTLFGIAPFVGMFISLLIFREAPQGLFFYSVPLMLIGAWLMLGEKHRHTHIHELLEHEHSHAHPDEHHAHEQTHSAPFIGLHSHKHMHEVVEHNHPHTPDLHHRHQHPS